MQPIAELAAVAHERGVPFHTDAVQAVAHLPVRFDESGADLMTDHRAQGRRARSASAPSSPGGTPRSCPSPTAAARSARCAAAPSTCPASGRSRSPLEETVAIARRRGQARHGPARPPPRGRPGPGPRHHGHRLLEPGRRHPPAPRQRPPARARLRGRLPALPPRRRRASSAAPGSACQAGVPQPSHVLLAMGHHRGRGAGRPAADLRPHVDRGRRRRLPRRPAGGRRAGPTGGTACSDARRRRHVGRGRLGRRRRPHARCRPRGRGGAPRPVPLGRDPARVAPAGCCTLEDAGDARRVADRLGIPFYVWDLASRFERDVVEDFVAEYAAGRTPNPCLRCNERIKFAGLLDKAVALGLRRGGDRPLRARRRAGSAGRELHRAVDVAKDQSYVLGVLDADQLARAFFPLGDSTKPQVREEAAGRGFSVARKPDSHDICFIPDGDTRGWLTRPAGGAARRARRRDVGGGRRHAHGGLWLHGGAAPGPRARPLARSTAHRATSSRSTPPPTGSSSAPPTCSASTSSRGEHLRWCGPAPDRRGAGRRAGARARRGGPGRLVDGPIRPPAPAVGRRARRSGPAGRGARPVGRPLRRHARRRIGDHHAAPGAPEHRRALASAAVLRPARRTSVSTQRLPRATRTPACRATSARSPATLCGSPTPTGRTPSPQCRLLANLPRQSARRIRNQSGRARERFAMSREEGGEDPQWVGEGAAGMIEGSTTVERVASCTGGWRPFRGADPMPAVTVDNILTLPRVTEPARRGRVAPGALGDDRARRASRARASPCAARSPASTSPRSTRSSTWTRWARSSTPRASPRARRGTRTAASRPSRTSSTAPSCTRTPTAAAASSPTVTPSG